MSEKTVFVTGQETCYDLLRMMPIIADGLGVRQEDLAVIHNAEWPAPINNITRVDKVLKAVGPMKGLPFVQSTALHAKGNKGYGAIFFQNRLDPTIQYATCNLQGEYGPEMYLVVPKNKIFRLKRNIYRQQAMRNKAGKPPILPEGILETVVKNSVGFLKNAKKLSRYGVRIKRGIILAGPPGNGKTMLCRYIQHLCDEKNIAWGTVSSSDMDKSYEGNNLEGLLSRWKVTFFDDIDISYMDRSKGNGKMACSLLSAMDGMGKKTNLVRIFTTNEDVGSLDPAFMRPGRIDKSITLGKPDYDLRKKLVEQHWPAEVREAIDIKMLLDRSDKMSFAELEFIRSILVSEKIFGSGKWDLEFAFREFEESRNDPSRRHNFGFR